MQPDGAATVAGALGMVERLLSLSEQDQQAGTAPQDQSRALADWLASGESQPLSALLARMASDVKSAARTLDSARAMWTGARQTADVPDQAGPGGDLLDGVSLVLTDIAHARTEEIWQECTSRFDRIVRTRFGGPAGFAAAALAQSPDGQRLASLLRPLLGKALGRSPARAHARPEPVAAVIPFLFNGLAECGELDSDTFRAAATANPELILRELGGLSRAPLAAPLTAAAREVLRDCADGLAWQLACEPSEESWTVLQHARGLRGSRFLLAALDLYTGRRGPGAFGGWNTYWVPKLISHLLAAEEVDPAAEPSRQQALARLRSEPEKVLAGMLALSLPNPMVPSVLVEALGWPDAAPLLSLFRAVLSGMASSPDRDTGAMDIPHVRDVLSRVSETTTCEMLAWLELHARMVNERLRDVGADLAEVRDSGSGAAKAFVMQVGAVAGRNRAEVEAGVRGHGQIAVRAYGALPVIGRTDVRERYLSLMSELSAAEKLDPDRRVSHVTAVRAGLCHLAQVAGYTSAARLAWAVEPCAADRDPAMDQVPEPDAEMQRAGRIRRIIEDSVVSGELVEPGELRDMLCLPAARQAIARMVLSARDGRFGILDPGTERVAGLSEVWTVDRPVAMAHPVQLSGAGELERWQYEITQRAISQPVVQVFRELYIPTPAERADGSLCSRFTGCQVNARAFKQHLSACGWRMVASWREGICATRVLQGVRAVLLFEDLPYDENLDYDYFDEDDPVSVGPLRFEPFREAADGQSKTLALAKVPPVVFSEILRDVGLAVTKAAWHGDAG